jgi:predicted transcriptional regulator
MSTDSLRRPTDRELDILSVLWRRGPSTVREVHGALGGDGAAGYTTTLKLMQIMHEKGLLTRDESARSHVYKAAAAEGVTQGGLVRDLIDRAFDGSAEKLVLRALSSGRIAKEELAAIRSLVEQLERGRRS